jgi:hypothetical protein
MLQFYVASLRWWEEQGGKSESDVNIKLNDLQGLIKMFLNHKDKLNTCWSLFSAAKKIENFPHLRRNGARDELASF